MADDMTDTLDEESPTTDTADTGDGTDLNDVLDAVNNLNKSVLLSGMANQEQQLGGSRMAGPLPGLGGPGYTPPPQPSPPGRMYMGPPISEQAFQAMPPGVTAPPPPQLSPQQQMAAQQRVAAGTGGLSPQTQLAQAQASDRPGSSTISVNTTQDPEIQAAAAAAQAKYEATQKYRSLVNSNVSPADAIAQSGLSMFAGGTPQKPMTAFQQAQVNRWQNPAVRPPRVMKSADGSIVQINPDGTTRTVVAAPPPTSTVRETVPEVTEAIPPTPAIPAHKGTGLFGTGLFARDYPAVPGTPGVPAHGPQTITTKQPIAPPVAPPAAAPAQMPPPAPVAQPQAVTRPPVVPVAKSKAAAKANYANQLASQHPDWSKQKIIDKVNADFEQGP